MKLKEEIDKTGKIPTYHLFNLIEELVRVDENKPSARIIRTERGKKAIAALEDIEINRNHSWYKELKNRIVNHEDEIALFYRGNKITFRELIKKADEVAKSMVSLGIKKGDEIPVCLANTPELVYIMLAANKIGAKLNLFSYSLDKEYLREIVSNCSDKVFFATDDVYDDIKDIIEERNFDNRVLISLTDSLPENPELTDEYEKELDKYYRYENKVPYFKKLSPEILSWHDFVSKGVNFDTKIEDDNDLDTEFLITYTSGSTKKGFPKQIIHSNRNLIIMGRFRDYELSGVPKIDGLRGIAHIHSDSNTNLVSCITDTLTQQWCVALEPEYSPEKALDYIVLNKPNICMVTTSFALRMAKDYLIEKKFEGRKMPYLFTVLAVGEATSKGEEKFINKFLKKVKAGSGVKLFGNVSFPYTTLGVGGGDCEHGGIYYSFWRTMFDKINYFKLRHHDYAMKQVPFAHIAVFKPKSEGLYEECAYNEMGIIAANSAATMVGYKNNVEATKKMIITDDMDRDWVSSNVYGYIDELGTVHVKGRVGNEIIMSDGNILLPYIVEDEICKDTKNILSCVVNTAYDEDNNAVPIVNIEFQPFKKKQDDKVLQSIISRLNNISLSSFTDSCLFRIFDNDNSFPLTGSGKRSLKDIEEKGLEDTFKYNNGIRVYSSVPKEKRKIKIRQKS